MGLQRLTPEGLFKPAAYSQVVVASARGRRCTGGDVVKLTTYVVGYKPELRPLLGEARSTVFGPGALPASTLVGVQALAEPGYLIEVEAFAVTDQA